MRDRDSRRDELLGMDANITRRDFVAGVLGAAGASLVPTGGSAAPTAAHAPSGSPWTGYGGVGDYQWSNGNTEAVRDAAHGIRDRAYADPATAPLVDEVDVVVVGGGFSGLTALYEFTKGAGARATALLLENHPAPGGEAKQNEFHVDGVRLVAPQGSNGGLVPRGDAAAYGGGRYAAYVQYWRELDMPSGFDLEPLGGAAAGFELPNDHYDPMVLERRFATAYFFGGRRWARNPQARGFAGTPWSSDVRRELDDFVNNRRDAVSAHADPDRWLDSITYHALLDRLGYGDAAKRYVDPLIGVGNFGVSGSAISALAAKRLTLPGTIPTGTDNRFANVEVVSFPGGNTTIYRRMLARALPGVIAGDGSMAATANAPFVWARFDAPGAAVRMRLGATVVDVRHEGARDAPSGVVVTYARGGRLERVRARAVVIASGGWVNRHVLADAPETLTRAYAQFHYGPVLTANVAVRHWRYFAKLGAIAVRWFEGLGWHLCVRRNVQLEPNARPFTPDSPTVLTFYIPFLNPTLPLEAQGPTGRAQLLAPTHADFERELRTVLADMFGGYGFDARRDIAGIVLNRWGHAYLAPPPGFFHGRNGEAAPHDVVRRGYGRVVIAHSELQGNMNMAHAMLEGRRGAHEALALLSGDRTA